MNTLPLLRSVRLAALCAVPLLLASCGGGSSSYQGSTLSGKVLMSSGNPLQSANVCVYAIAGGAGDTPLNVSAGATNPLYDSTGTVLISNTGYTYSYRGTTLTTGTPPSCGVVTGSDGSFSVNLASFYGPVLIQVSGGSYSFGGTSTTLHNLTNTISSLQAVAVIGGGGTVPVLVTPLTTIATNIALAPPLGSLSSRMDTSNYNSALAFVAQQFGFSSTGEFPLTAPTSTSTAPAIVSGSAYDMVLKGVQQYLISNGFCTSSSSCGADPNGTNLLEWATYVNATNYATSPAASDLPTLSTNTNSVYAKYQAAYQTANSTSFTPTSFAAY